MVTLLADCLLCRKIIHNEHMEELQMDLNRLGEWAFENNVIIIPTKSKVL
jgi:hypothetical protein